MVVPRIVPQEGGNLQGKRQLPLGVRPGERSRTRPQEAAEELRLSDKVEMQSAADGLVPDRR